MIAQPSRGAVVNHAIAFLSQAEPIFLAAPLDRLDRQHPPAADVQRGRFAAAKAEDEFASVKNAFAPVD